MYPMIFGGAFYSELDLCAATCVNRFLKIKNSKCKAAVTHKSDITYLGPTYVGDLIFMEAKVIGTGKKSVSVWVDAFRESRGSTNKDKVAEGRFVFISIANSDRVGDKPKLLPYKEHGVSL